MCIFNFICSCHMPIICSKYSEIIYGVNKPSNLCCNNAAGIFTDAGALPDVTMPCSSFILGKIMSSSSVPGRISLLFVLSEKRTACIQYTAYTNISFGANKL